MEIVEEYEGHIRTILGYLSVRVNSLSNVMEAIMKGVDLQGSRRFTGFVGIDVAKRNPKP